MANEKRKEKSSVRIALETGDWKTFFENFTLPEEELKEVMEEKKYQK